MRKTDFFFSHLLHLGLHPELRDRFNRAVRDLVTKLHTHNTALLGATKRTKFLIKKMPFNVLTQVIRTIVTLLKYLVVLRCFFLYFGSIVRWYPVEKLHTMLWIEIQITCKKAILSYYIHNGNLWSVFIEREEAGRESLGTRLLLGSRVA